MKAAAALSTTAPLVKPNIILILTDDQRYDTLEQMPNVRNLLAGHGVTFTNAFASSPICCPSRATMLTGQYAHNTGVLDNVPPQGGVSAFRNSSTIATWMKAAGYRTALMGKYLNGYSGTVIPPGWNKWRALGDSGVYYNYQLNENGTLVSYGSQPQDYFTTVLFERAKAFITSGVKPFFLYLSPPAPHIPSTPAPPDIGAFGSLPGYRPPSFNEADVSDKPWAAGYPLLTATQIATIDAERRNALASLLAVDRGVADLVALLESRGLLANTIIAFTSDNGYLLGEHRLVHKQWVYEPSIRVPLVFRLPWQLTARTDEHLVLNVDLPRTFASLGGATTGVPQNGKDLTPLLLGPTTSWRTKIYLEFLAPTPAPLRPPPYRAIRTVRWKYVEFENGWRELYDLTFDPNEMNNLAGNPTYAVAQAQLAADLAQLSKT